MKEGPYVKFENILKYNKFIILRAYDCVVNRIRIIEERIELPNENYLEFAVTLARQAGAIMKKDFSLATSANWKDDLTPVTKADMKITNLVGEAIKKEFPGHGLLTEEQEVTASNGYLWVCDPIDGTFAFAHGLPTAVFALALTYHGRCILGVSYDPFLDRLYRAQEGMGAFLNEKKVNVSAATALDLTVIGVSLWARAAYEVAPLFQLLEQRNVLVVNLASNIYTSSLVAAGSLAACIYNDDKAHDMAAVKILVEEAGGKVTDLQGNAQMYDGSEPIRGGIISNGLLHDQLVKLVAESINLKPA